MLCKWFLSGPYSGPLLNKKCSAVEGLSLPANHCYPA